MNISIERANINDIPALIEVQDRSFEEDFNLYGECPAYNESLEAMKEHLKNCIVYKIVADGKIVGDVIIRKRDNNSYYLRVLSVIPEYQSLGLGTKAINYIENDNVDAEAWELITPHRSFRNHHLYEKMGYVKNGEIVHSDVLTLWEYRKVIKR